MTAAEQEVQHNPSGYIYPRDYDGVQECDHQISQANEGADAAASYAGAGRLPKILDPKWQMIYLLFVAKLQFGMGLICRILGKRCHVLSFKA